MQTSADWPTANGRTVLFLQGPPGPFFKRLAQQLEALGARTLRVRINAGDFCDSIGQRSISYRGTFTRWPDWLRDLGRRHRITDVVLYGDCRPYHRVAIDVLKRQGARIHVFEEGYIRPRWITYERDGVNGHSKLVSLPLERIDVDKVAAAPAPEERSISEPMWPYIRKGLRYYTCNFLGVFAYPFYRTHRAQGLIEEAWTWTLRWPILPWVKANAQRLANELIAAGKPYHLVLLQLSGDFQLRAHSPFNSISEFIDLCIRAYANSGVQEKLVFKNHPLDAGHVNLRQIIRDSACAHGVEDRCVFVDGGKLAPLLTLAKSVTAVNTTSCQQTIMRGIPTRILGKAVYNHRGLVSGQPLEAFFRDPAAPDVEQYAIFQKFLLLTCQVNGGFYTPDGIALAVRNVARRMLRDRDPLFDYVRDAESGPPVVEAAVEAAE